MAVSIHAGAPVKIDVYAVLVFQTGVEVTIANATNGVLKAGSPVEATKVVDWLHANGYPNAAVE